MKLGKRTYFGIGIAASAVNLLGGALYISGSYIPWLFTVANMLGGGMMLLLANERRAEKPYLVTALLGAALIALTGFSGVPGIVGGALAWPVFAVPYWRDAAPESAQKTLPFCVVLAGAVQLALSFAPLPPMIAGVLVIVFSLVQGLFAYVLFSAEAPAA